jgi:hypothetical protein
MQAALGLIRLPVRRRGHRLTAAVVGRDLGVPVVKDSQFAILMAAIAVAPFVPRWAAFSATVTWIVIAAAAEIGGL